QPIRRQANPEVPSPVPSAFRSHILVSEGHMNYKTTNRLLRKGNGRAIVYQVACAAVALAVIAPASYLYGVATAGEGVNLSLYQRVFSETVRPEGSASLPDSEVTRAIWALGGAPVERSTYNGVVIWTTS